MRNIKYIIASLFLLNADSFFCMENNSTKKSETSQQKYKRDQLARDFIEYAKKGDIQKVEEYLDSGIDINITDVRIATALMLATSSNQIETARLLLEKKADINIQSIYKKTALTIACEFGYIEIAKLLIEAKADLDKQTCTLETALILTLNNKPKVFLSINKIDIAILLINEGANVNLKDQQGNTALIYAILLKNKKIIKLIINSGADLNIKNKFQKTPLMLCVENKNKTLVKLLINKGANSWEDLRSIYEQIFSIKIVLTWTRDSQNLEELKDMFELIKKYLIYNAVKKGDKKIVKSYIYNKLPLGIKYKNNNTLLHIAIKSIYSDPENNDKLIIVKYLIAAKPDLVSTYNQEGKIAFDINPGFLRQNIFKDLLINKQ